MKTILLTVLLMSASLMATDGESLYKQRCELCHGVKADKSPQTGVPILAGRTARELAMTIRAYRDQDERVGAYTMHKTNRVMGDATSSLNRDQLNAIAVYISELK